MVIGGFDKFSIIDFPGKTSAIIFTQGCNFRCKYCHNPELCPFRREGILSFEEVCKFLGSRRGMLDAVTITGGEPTLQTDLIEAMERIKGMGFLIKLDTNGSNPDVIKKVIDKKLADYLAMDVKAPIDKYQEIAGCAVPPDPLKRSIKLIMNSGVSHEFRTTAAKSFLSKDDLRRIVDTIKGADKYCLQKFIPAKKMNDPSFANSEPYSEEDFDNFKKDFEGHFKECSVRL